jgi:hypothetical protein
MPIEAIQSDIRLSENALGGGGYQELAADSFLSKL